MRDQRFYVYKCVVDDGGAPCVDNDLLTLTICKPYIRSTADKGDLIFAFGSNKDIVANRLVYIAEVGRKLINGTYFECDEYRTRGDCIYERIPDGRLARRKDARFHNFEGARNGDLGEEGRYPKANALVASDFRYFGEAGAATWKIDSPNLQELVEMLGQGHRVNFKPELLAELKQLKDRVWKDHPQNKVLGKPMHAPDELVDPDSDDVVEVCGNSCNYRSKVC